MLVTVIITSSLIDESLFKISLHGKILNL